MDGSNRELKRITVKVNEEKVVPFVWINGEEEQIDMESVLDQENSSIHIVGIFLGSEKKEIACNTFVTHVGKNTKSRMTIRAVFFDRSSFRNDGLIRIKNGAKNADGYFDSKILLFDDAKGRSVPSLEIDENELKAGHASTVGRPDAEQLFYLRSRGLSEADAEKLLIAGFFEPALRLLPIDVQTAVKEQIENVL